MHDVCVDRELAMGGAASVYVWVREGIKDLIK